MRRWGLVALLLSTACLAQAGVLRIEGSLADDDSLLLRYTPPEGVRELTLTHSEPLRAWWSRQASAANDCTELAPGLIRLKPGCSQAAIKLSPALLAAYAHYEPAQPLGQAPDPRGVLGYLGYYLTPLAGHGLSWRWQAPVDGSLLYQGRWSSEPMQADFDAAAVDEALAQRRQGRPWLRALGAHQMVYLGRAPSLALPQGRLVFDARLDADRRDSILDTLARTQSRLRQVYGLGLENQAGVVVALADWSGFHGDASDGPMMRLRLPLVGKAEDEAWLRRFVSHEVVHWWNAGVFRSDQDRPWLHEGHAEWMALLLGLEQAWLSEAAVTRDLERHLNECLRAAGGLAPVLGLRGHNSASYDCGVSLMLLAQAHASADATAKPVAAVTRLASLHKAGERLDAQSLGRWSTSLGFARLLSAEDAQLGAGLVAQLLELGLADAQPLRDSDLPQSASRTWLSQLMEADCGSYGFFANNSEIQLDARATQRCRSWPKEGRVQRVAGVPAFGQLLSAHMALTQACAQGTHYRLGLADGVEHEALCPATLPAKPFEQSLKLRPGALRRLQALAP